LTPSRLLLLVTPPNEQAIASAVQALGRRLGANLKVGVVFNGRYKTALIEPALFIPAQIWLESSPELDGYAVDAVTWRWSSAGIHTGAMALACPLAIPLTDHDKYWACGNTPFDRQATYLSLLREGLSGSQRQSIESAISGQWALGSTAYVTQIAKVASRRAAPGRRGRPPKAVL
jgi:putative transposase